MLKKYNIKNKNLSLVQNLLDELKAHPDRKIDIYAEKCKNISKEDIHNDDLRDTIEKMINEFKDFSYDEIFDEIQKMQGGF